MNNLEIFENEEFGSIRTMLIDEVVWFVGKDVAFALGYVNPRDTLSKRVDDEDKGVAKCDSLGGIQEMTIINESGLYSLILSSKLPTAKKFKRWVTSEVLPSIRRSGQYIAPAEVDRCVIPMIPEPRDYLQAAKLIAHCPMNRMRLVMRLLEKGGFDLSTVKRENPIALNTVDISERINEAMQLTGLGVYALAEAIGTSGSSFRAYRVKDRFPKPKKYEELVIALDEICNRYLSN